MSAPLDVERDEITNVAMVFDTTADVIEYEGAAAARCAFDGPMAGRNYTESGTAIHGGFGKIAASLAEWQSQSQGIAKSMRAAMTRYDAQDRHNADTLAGER